MTLDDLIKAVEAGEATRTEIEELATAVFGLSIMSVNIGSAYARKDLNAANAVHDALLPGWEWNIDAGDGAYVENRGDFGVPCPADIPGMPARAWLLAIFKAKQAEGRG